MVDLPFPIWIGLTRLESNLVNEKRLRWVPLVLALDWVEQHPDDPAHYPAQEILGNFFNIICGKNNRGNARDPMMDQSPQATKTETFDR
jgi:hypothetical protein